MVFSKIFESISGFFSPEESYKRANKYKIEDENQTISKIEL